MWDENGNRPFNNTYIRILFCDLDSIYDNGLNYFFLYVSLPYDSPFFSAVNIKYLESKKKTFWPKKTNNQTFYYGMGISTMLSEEL